MANRRLEGSHKGASDSQGISRRHVLAAGIAGGAVVALDPRLVLGAPAKARVVRVESKRVWNGDARDPKIVATMIDRGLMALTGAASERAAWQTFIKPEMRVGLKINLLGRPLIYTAPEITDAATRALLGIGVKPGNLVVWDRFKDHFTPTVYKLGAGAHGERIESGGQYDATVQMKGSKGTAALDRMMTETTDVTISLPVLKDHVMAGVTLALKNVAFGCYEHYQSAHENNCEPFISEANEHCRAHAKIPLIIMDATAACFDNGPRPSDAGRLWRENAIYVATDPVALDVICRKVIMGKRKEKGLSDKTAQAMHIEAAGAKGLGIADPSRIELVTIKV